MHQQYAATGIQIACMHLILLHLLMLMWKGLLPVVSGALHRCPCFQMEVKMQGIGFFGYVQVSLAINSPHNRLPHNSALHFYEISVILRLLGVLSQATVAHTAMTTHRLPYGAPGTVTSAWCMQCSILIILLTPVTT